jgi:hypothetical protein
LSKPTTLERRLALSAPSCRVTTAVRQHAAAAYELGDLHGLALWLQVRARLARLSPVELQELRALARVLVRQSSAIRRSLERQLQAAAEQHQVPASLSWEQRQQLLVQREAQRRAGDRQPVPIIAPSAAPVPMGRHSRQARGECGVRLARKIDRLLVESQGAPPPATAPEAAAAGDQPEVGMPDQRQPMAQSPAAEPALAPRVAWPISPSLLPATPAGAVVAPAPRKRAPRGTCCPRELELPLTLLLQRIHHHEDELDWPEDPEFPWELAIETLEELQASGAPLGPSCAEHQAPAEPETLGHQIGDHREPGPEAADPAAAGDLVDPPEIYASSNPEALAHQPELQPMAEPAMADLHEQVLVAAAQADLEPEPAEPLPVSIHALEAAKELIPAGAVAPAELSPRARAIAELGAALLQGGPTVTLPAATAAELLEALVAA